MNGPVRLHLVEPQPLLRSRLLQSLEAAGAQVSFGDPLEPVMDGFVVVLNLDGHTEQWNHAAADVARQLPQRTVVTSANGERLAAALPFNALGALRRPFSATELMQFVAERLAAPATSQRGELALSTVPYSDDSDVSVSGPPAYVGNELPTIETESVGAPPYGVRAVSDSATEVELDAVHPLHDMVIWAYVDTLAGILPSLTDKDSQHTRAALRALLVRFAEELTYAG